MLIWIYDVGIIWAYYKFWLVYIQTIYGRARGADSRSVFEFRLFFFTGISYLMQCTRARNKWKIIYKTLYNIHVRVCYYFRKSVFYLDFPSCERVFHPIKIVVAEKMVRIYTWKILPIHEIIILHCYCFH